MRTSLSSPRVSEIAMDSIRPDSRPESPCLQAESTPTRRADNRTRGRPAWGWSVGTGATWGHLSIDMAFVSQTGAYNIDFTFQGSSYSFEGVTGTFQDTWVQRSTRDDKYKQNRLYASAIVRF